MKPQNQEIDSRRTGYGKGRDRKRRGRNDVTLATWNVMRWVDDLEEDLKKIGIRGWQRIERAGGRLLQRSRPFKGCSTTDDDDTVSSTSTTSVQHVTFYPTMPPLPTPEASTRSVREQKTKNNFITYWFTYTIWKCSFI
jgi:hypothetical protein